MVGGLEFILFCIKFITILLIYLYLTKYIYYKLIKKRNSYKKAKI